MGTRDVMDTYIGAVRGGDREKAFALFSDDVVGHVPGRSAMAGTLEGAEAVRGYVEGVVALGHGDVQVDVVDLLIGEEHAALMVRERIGADLDIRRCNVYRVRGDRITEIWIFEHDQYAVDEWIASLRPGS